MIKRLAVKTPSERQPIGAMSGGNAQKVVLARQLVERPKLLVLAEPTQGVDVGAKEEIHRIITALADNGIRAAKAEHEMIGQSGFERRPDLPHGRRVQVGGDGVGPAIRAARVRRPRWSPRLRPAAAASRG